MIVQALTWRAKAPKQQDSLLISNGDDIARIISHESLISRPYQFYQQDFILAVADGIASSPYSGLVSQKLLFLLDKQFKQQAISFQALQNQLNDYFIKEKYQGAGSTLAMVHYQAQYQHFQIRHLGDSRVYHFNKQNNQWTALTQDHTYLNELKQEIPLDNHQEYASSYDILYHYFCIDDEYHISYFPPQYLTLNTGDCLLLCTDGVHDVLSCEHWLAPYTDDLKSWLIAMQKLLHSKGAWDNITMILLMSSDGEKS